ncbi:MAG: AraC family transcriptional regulator [Hyphomonadaceae bacterium]|nr:AraC family transcriptional regulator [Hyphomonadaceae bacterium]
MAIISEINTAPLGEHERLVRVGVLKNLDRALHQSGSSLQEVSRVTGFSQELMDDEDVLISLRYVAQLLTASMRATNQQHFPLILAGAQDISFLGSVGLLMKTASSLREALAELGLFIHAHAEPVVWLLEENGADARLSVSIDAPWLSAEARRLCVSLALAQCYKTIQWVTNDSVELEGVELVGPAPQDTFHYRQYFHCQVRFNCEANCLILRPESLNKPVLYSDAALHQLVRQQLSIALPASGQPILERRVRAVIRSLLASQRCDIESVARCFNCDKRTLQRKLRTEAGKTYQMLLDAVRYDLARQYLSETAMSVTQIAFSVGFSDPSNFARAFRQKTGVSPRGWRVQNRTMARQAGHDVSRPEIVAI